MGWVINWLATPEADRDLLWHSRHRAGHRPGSVVMACRE
jgi:hypothetical protein